VYWNGIPASAPKRDLLDRRVLLVALAASELAGLCGDGASTGCVIVVAALKRHPDRVGFLEAKTIVSLHENERER
jgi:hypothetical protein